jgi:hypothetical protein
MTKSLMRRASLLVFVLALIGATVPNFHQSTALADFDYMCDSWEESCDDGSGGTGGGTGSGSGSGGAGWLCPTNNGSCASFGCNPRSYADPTQVCSRWLIQGQSGSCPSPVNCTRTNL